MIGRRAQNRRDQRSRILDVARRLFAESGPDDVTMSEVAKGAGVARATVFNHFGSKHALIEGITEEVQARYLEMLETALADSDAPTQDLLRGLFQNMGAGIERDRRFYRGVFREITKLAIGLDEGGPGQRARQASLERLVQLLTRGQARRELSGEHRPEDLAAAIDSLVYGTITHWLYDDPSESLEQRMLRAAEVFLGPIEIAPGRTRKKPAPRTRTTARGRGRS